MLAQRLRVLFKDPLIHFLLLGGVCFGLLGAQQPPPQNDQRIAAGTEQLALYLQYRAKAFDPDKAHARLAAMPVSERQQLRADYVREEVLFREAQRLNLADSDYMIRLRLVQKMEFVLQELAEQAQPVDDETLKAFYRTQPDRYRESARFTFTHVFVSIERWGEEGAERRAESLGKQLNQQLVRFDQAGRFGDRFAYQRNYVDRSIVEVARDFGQPFAEQLLQLEATGSGQPRWSSPMRSDNGYHLVLLSQRTEAKIPDYAELKPRLLEDYRYQQAGTARQQAIDALIERYQVEES